MSNWVFEIAPLLGTVHFSWIPWKRSKAHPPLEKPEYSSRAPARGPVHGSRLKHIEVLFRHGARTPLTSRYWDGATFSGCGDEFKTLLASLRKDTKIDTALDRPSLAVHDKTTKQQVLSHIDERDSNHIYPGGCARGELTCLGKQQAVELGTWLRHRYGQDAVLQLRNYNSSRVHAHSTNYRRTRDTMMGVLLGLFPGHAGEFTVETSGHDDELMLIQVQDCPNLLTWYKANRSMLKQMDSTDPELVAADEHVRNILGHPLDDTRKRVHFGELNDALTSMRAHGQSIPPFSPADLDLINRLATERMVHYFSDSSDHLYLSLGLGQLLHVIRERLYASATAPAATEDPVPRTSLLCGHDTSLMPLLLMLGQSIPRWPPYASSVVIELWEDTTAGAQALPMEKRHYVRVLFNGRETAVPPASSSAGDSLTLEQFREHILERYALSPDKYAADCGKAKSWWAALGLGGGGKVDTSSY